MTARQRRFRVTIAICGLLPFNRHLQHLRQVQRPALRSLRDLLAATEAVDDDQPVGRGLADGGKEFEFADGHGDVVFAVFEAEGASHATAARGGSLEVDAEAAEEGFFSGHLHHRFLMAVAVEDGLAVKLGEGNLIGFEEFA